MTAQTRSVNKAKFEQGDTPQGSDYVDLIDSFLSLADSSAQSVVSNVTFSSGIVTTTVSASDVFADNYHTVNASVLSVDTATIVAVSGSTATFGLGTFTRVVTETVSASAAKVTTLGVGTAAPTAGFWLIGSEGNAHLDIATTTQASGGGGGAVPTSAAAFGIITVNGTKYYVPLFNVK